MVGRIAWLRFKFWRWLAGVVDARMIQALVDTQRPKGRLK